MSPWETIKAFLGYGNGRDPAVIDHAQINHSPGQRKKLNKKLAEKLAEAEKQHGKPFHTHENKSRETPPSRDLLAIQEQQQKMATSAVKDDHAATVTKMEKVQ